MSVCFLTPCFGHSAILQPNYIINEAEILIWLIWFWWFYAREGEVEVECRHKPHSQLSKLKNLEETLGSLTVLKYLWLFCLSKYIST